MTSGTKEDVDHAGPSVPLNLSVTDSTLLLMVRLTSFSLHKNLYLVIKEITAAEEDS